MVLTRRHGLLWALALGLAGPASAAERADPMTACAKQFAQRPDDYDSAYCFYKLTLDGYSWRAAAGQFEALMVDHPGNFWLPVAYGHMYRTRDPDQTERLYRQAAIGFRSQGNADGELVARSNLRLFLFPRGRIDDAAREMARVLEIGEASHDPLVKARAWSLQAQHIEETGGDLGHAFRLLKLAEAAIFPDGPYRMKRATLDMLGVVAASAGRFDEALSAFHRLGEVAEAARDLRTLALARYNIFYTTSTRETLLPTPGGRERLVGLLDRALTAGRTAGHELVMIRSHSALAEILTNTPGARASALAHVSECLALARKAQQAQEEAVCSWIEAELARSVDMQKAQAAEARALVATARANTPRTDAVSAARHMRLSWSTASRAEAIRESLAAIDAVETLRALQDDDESSAGMFSAWTLDYYWLSGRLLEDRRDADVPLAFSITERMRARALLDALERSRADRHRQQPAFATLAQVQSALADDEALLSFQVGLWETFEGNAGGGSWLIAATRGQRTVHRLPDRVQLSDVIPMFVGLIAAENGREGPAAARLYRDLLADALGALPSQITRLVIVADGPLHRLPFEALRPSPDAAPLGARYQVTVAPSATLWLQWRGARAQLPRSVLTLADPVRGDSVDDRHFGQLPHARRESRAIARHIGSVDAFVGADASESALKSRDLRRYGIVHLAAHAIADDARPERSAIVLAPGNRQEDGLLLAREIEALDLTGRIVVLSACQTAGGSVISGEGVLSLARAFFEAGAHAVVGSRWPLRDADAAALFDTFYWHLGRGASLAEALRATQESSRAAGRPASTWAALVLLGNGDLRPFVTTPASTSFPHVPMVFTMGLTLVIALSVVRTRRRRSSLFSHSA